MALWELIATESRKGPSSARSSSKHHWPRRQKSEEISLVYCGHRVARVPSRCRETRRGSRLARRKLANGGGGAARPRRPARRFYFCRQSAKWARDPGQNPPSPSSPLIGARRRSCSRHLLTGRCSAGCCKGGVWRCRDSRTTARPANRGRSRWRQVKNSSHSLSCRTLCVGHSAVDLHQHDAGH